MGEALRQRDYSCSCELKPPMLAGLNLRCLTYRISQSEIVALRGKYREEPSLAVATPGTGDQQREDADYEKHRRLGDEDAPEEGPDDITEVQQHHVLEQQRREGKLGHEIPQTFGLGGGDDVRPPCDVSAQDYPEALQERREELVDGHGGGGSGGVERKVEAAAAANASPRRRHRADPLLRRAPVAAWSVCGHVDVMARHGSALPDTRGGNGARLEGATAAIYAR